MSHPLFPPGDFSSKQPLMDEKSTRPKTSSGLARFSKAVCVAVAVYIFFGLFTKCAHFAVNLKSNGVNDFPWEKWGPREEDGTILGCANLTADSRTVADAGLSPLFTSTDVFHIPTSDKILVFSRGSYGHGTIRTELSNSSGDKVEIEVITRSWTARARYHAQVCHLDREQNVQGIGIYTPRQIFNNPHYREKITFDVTIRFPRSGSATKPLVITSLQTDMGIWRHEIGSLEDSVVFKSLSLSGSNAGINTHSVSAESVKLKTSNAGIQTDAVSAESVDIKTSNGRITGSYNVSRSLVLKTSNAPIEVTLRMENGDGSDPTHVDMRTSNGKLASSISLISTAKSPVAFSVRARTSNGALSTIFTDAPSSPFAQLSLNARTSNMAAHTKLPLAYEGSVILWTSVFTPSVVQTSDPTDPSGKGRHRKVDIRRIVRGVLDARVWWGDKDDGKANGKVVVTTSNAHNTVELN